MKAALENKLRHLPRQPGVYFFKDAAGKIIYIGKAAVLKNRVSSYFQKSRYHDPKTLLLIGDIADLDWITVESEVEALFLESEFIKRYKPKYNLDLRDEKLFIYVKFSADEYPVISYVRRPLDDKASYFGPFIETMPIRRAMKMLRRVFPYVTHETLPQRACLQVHLGLCPNPEERAISPAEYRRKHIKPLIMYFTGQRDKVIGQLEKEMQRAAKAKDFEAAARLRDQVHDLRALSKQMIFGDKEAFDLSKDQALSGLAERLGLPQPPRRIEAYDISHIQGSDNVASMIVFTDGVPDRGQYRKFKMKLHGNDDFAHMREVISRRFSKIADRDWPKPDLILIDGGKGQLSGALSVLVEKGIDVPTIGLAKREEEIIRSNGEEFEVIVLPKSSHVLHLLQRVRDEAHRFAVTYHSLLRSKRQTKSVLDFAPGIGPATRKKLIKAFGSGQAVKLAEESEIASVIGPAKAKKLKRFLTSSV